MRHFKIWLSLILVSSALSACDVNPDIQVNDHVIGGYEGAAGGAIACVEVHTIFSDIAPAHFGLADCLQRLIGKVYLEGDAVNEMATNIDAMCTALGSCSYQQEQAIQGMKAAIQQAQRVNPRRREFRP